jgi:MinD superfamily P-loop ATPase
MRIAVASGKGGTGKTTVAVALAQSLGRAAAGRPRPLLLDCDVEAPDAHLFVHPRVERIAPVLTPVPRIDASRCTLCGACIDRCMFNALAILGDRVLVFPELCHGCGSCMLGCPERAIVERMRELGRLEAGSAGEIAFARGILNVGEAMAVPVIRRLKAWARPEPGQTVVLDAPPGTSCPVVETLRGADRVLLVTEPTPFGLHDLELAFEVVRALRIPAAVVVNRVGEPFEPLDRFCRSAGLPVLFEIPFDRAIAVGLATGRSLLDVRPEYEARFRALAASLVGLRPVETSTAGAWPSTAAARAIDAGDGLSEVVR